MERRCKSQQQLIFELKQELTTSTAELKLRLAQAEGNVISYEHIKSFCNVNGSRDFLCV